jgi:hypothetical protein
MSDVAELSPDILALRERESYIELNGRARAQFLLDASTFHKLLGSFDRVQSPWLASCRSSTTAAWLPRAGSTVSPQW